MTIIIDGYIENNEIIAGDTVYRNLYDPNGLLEKYGDGSDVIITIQVLVSKRGRLVSLVDNITKV